MIAQHKLEIQIIVEKILQKHNIDPSAHTYYLKLRMESYDDLVLEKEGEQILVGHYYHHPSGDLISDPVLVFDYNGGYWFPVRIEQVLGDTICSYLEDGVRWKYPRKIKEFRLFQKMFAKNIEEQGWLGDGMKVD